MPENKYDSIRIYKGDQVVMNGHSYYIFTDTVLLLPKTYKYKIVRDRAQQTKLFFERMKERSRRSWFTRSMFDLFVCVSGTSTQIKEKQTDRDFTENNGKIIRNIRLMRLDPFGTDINDTSAYKTNWFGRTANYLHVRTKSRIIWQNIFLKKGNKLNINEIYENERLLRTQPYLQDAKIVIDKIRNDSIDLLVITKDLFPLTFDGELGSPTSFNIQSNNDNFLGFGRQLATNYIYDATNQQKHGFELSYKIENIYGTFITSAIKYSDINNYKSQQAYVRRNFLTTQSKYAGSVELEKTEITDSYTDTDNNSLSIPLSYNLQKYWLGRAFKFSEKIPNERLVLSAMYSRKKFVQIPQMEIETSQLFRSYQLWLSSISLLKRKYKKTKMLYTFGKTEDIPVGHLCEFAVGYQKNDDNNRVYISQSIYFGSKVTNLGYAFFKTAFGTFLNSGEIEQGVFRTELKFFSNLYLIQTQKQAKRGEYKWVFRNFVRIHYVEGYNRFALEYLELRNSNGIRGLSSSELWGNSRMAGSFETVGFSPWYFYGFHVALFSFFDLGFIQRNSKIITNQNLYTGFGFGVRFRNENLIIKTFGIRLAFYPRIPSGVSPVGFEITDERPLRLDDFDAKQPTILPFQ